MSVSGSLPEVGELSSTADPKVRTLLNELKTEVNAQGELQHAVKWYEPKIIATEQTRESATPGTLATADEITGVVLPTNGIIKVSYAALWKSSVATAGRVGIYLNAGIVGTLFNAGAGAEEATTGTTFHTLQSGRTAGASPLRTGLELTSIPTAFAWNEVAEIQAAAGTYAVAVKFSAISGSVTVKERSLRVEVHGV